MLYHPFLEFGDALKIRLADAVLENFLQRLRVLGRTEIALVGGGADEIQIQVQAALFEGLPFAFVQPDAAGGGAAINEKGNPCPALQRSITTPDSGQMSAVRLGSGVTGME